MQGLAAISANNGWAIALAGASIVITGLATLSFIISQLHRIIGFFEDKDKSDKAVAIDSPSPAPVEITAAEDDLLMDLGATAGIYVTLTAELGETFSLARLYGLMESKMLPHPHITVRELRSAGYLVPAGEGSFSWKTD